MYSCDDVLAELGNYLEDETTAEVRAQLELHLANCKTCRVLYDSTRKTLQIVTDSTSFELPERISEPLIKKIMDRVRENDLPAEVIEAAD